VIVLVWLNRNWTMQSAAISISRAAAQTLLYITMLARSVVIVVVVVEDVVVFAVIVLAVALPVLHWLPLPRR